jgi:hypothetical protein
VGSGLRNRGVPLTVVVKRRGPAGRSRPPTNLTTPNDTRDVERSPPHALRTGGRADRAGAVPLHGTTLPVYARDERIGERRLATVSGELLLPDDAFTLPTRSRLRESGTVRR